MSDILRPVVGYIPASKFGSRVAGPPRATLTAGQRAAASKDALSFRFTAGRKAGCSKDEALRWLADCASQGVLLPIGPAALVYRQEKGDFVATGILGDLLLRAYETGQVKRHEKTIAKTQRRMAEYMRTTRVYGNPAVTALPPDTKVEQAIESHTGRQPDSAFTTVDGIFHQLWVIEGDEADQLCGQANSDYYITDGHHRLAAAALVAREEGRVEARMPIGVFSANQLRLRSFARCLTDPELDPADAISKLQSSLECEEVARPEEAVPRERHEFGARIGQRFFRLRIPDDRIPEDHHSSLNTNLLQELVLGPLFGIEDPRTDRRLQFVADLGNIHEATAEADACLLPFPLEASDVIAVADSDRTMPPKSTWFAPKLPSGLVIRPIEEP